MNTFGSALSTASDLDQAIDECVRAASAKLGGVAPDVAIAFVSHDHQESGRLDDADLPARIRAATGATHLIGCVGETVIGTGREPEGQPAVSLWLARFPEASVQTFRVEVKRTERAFEFHGMPAIQQLSAEEYGERQSSIVVLGDPFSFPVDHWLHVLNSELTGLPVFGGLASGARAHGQSRLFLQDEILTSGAVGLLLDGVPVRTIVSQGCRPVGKPMVITRGHDNVIDEVAGQPPLAALQDFFTEGDEEEKELIQNAAQGGGLHIGQVVDEHISQPGRGDFLVRNVMGADNEKGSMAISDLARVGRTVCFHVRDAASADEDLRELLRTTEGIEAGGALLFSCNGRGKNLFGESDHDAACVHDQLGEIPLAGFFAAGEIGPVGGNNFLHGFTASVAVFLEQ